jgi:hypothetical protein
MRHVVFLQTLRNLPWKDFRLPDYQILIGVLEALMQIAEQKGKSSGHPSRPNVQPHSLHAIS